MDIILNKNTLGDLSVLIKGVLMMFCKSKIFSSLFMLSFLVLPAISSKVIAEQKQQNTSLEESFSENKEVKVDIEKLSEAFGHVIWKQIVSLGIDLDMNQVIKGLEDSIVGKNSPMNETECFKTLSVVQEEAFQKRAKKNLDIANAFMANNAKNTDIIEIEANKLQYKVAQWGTGDVVEPHYSPMVRYSGSLVTGEVFIDSQEDEMVFLDETPPGFTKAIVGMQEGEKRTIFVHPEWGYGAEGYLPPNSVLIFDVEVVKANAVHEQGEDLSSSEETQLQEITSSTTKGNDEAVR